MKKDKIEIINLFIKSISDFYDIVDDYANKKIIINLGIHEIKKQPRIIKIKEPYFIITEFGICSVKPNEISKFLDLYIDISKNIYDKNLDEMLNINYYIYGFFYLLKQTNIEQFIPFLDNEIRFELNNIFNNGIMNDTAEFIRCLKEKLSGQQLIIET